MSMEVIRAEFVITTPMFLGEADGQCAQLVRPPSIKGALRFWWRAMNWAPIRQRHSSDAEALVELHRQEGELFGASAKTAADGETQQGGQGCFLLRVNKQKLANPTSANFVGNKSELGYLLGQGLYEHPTRANNNVAKIKKEYLPAAGCFPVELALKPGIRTEQREQVLNTLKCFGLLGCLGSRARKGFGSVSMTSLVSVKNGQEESLSMPKNEADYKAELQALLRNCFSARLPDAPLTAVTANTRIQIAASGRRALDLLGDHGFQMGMFRSYGRDVGGVRRTFSQESEQNFKPDHDWAHKLSLREPPVLQLPKRAVFGLPHPYRMSSGVSVFLDVDLSGKSKRNDLRNDKKLDNTRRASPMLAHIHKIDDNNYLLVQVLMPGLFLPDRANLIAGIQDRDGNISHLVNAKTADDQSLWCWDEIHKFMDRFTNKDMIHG
jgi:CRISPR-associated protein Cmr1